MSQGVRCSPAGQTFCCCPRCDKKHDTIALGSRLCCLGLNTIAQDNYKLYVVNNNFTHMPGASSCVPTGDMPVWSHDTCPGRSSPAHTPLHTMVPSSGPMQCDAQAAAEHHRN